MLSEQLSEERVKDGFALSRIKDDEQAWAALGRLVLRMNADVIDQWSRDKTIKRSYVDGARSSLGAILPAILQMIEDSQTVAEEQKHSLTIVRSSADDGVGSGDLAIA